MESLFAHAVAKKLSLKLLEPDEDWLVRLPLKYRKRDVRLSILGDARRLSGPAFVKPPNEKLFPAQVYASGEQLPADYDDSMLVLIAEPVSFEVEYRCFMLDRQVKTMSPYLKYGQFAKLDDFAGPANEIEEASIFARQLLADDAVPLPRAVTLDVGVIADRGWAVVELNAAWGSGIYGCDPAEVLAVIRHATTSYRADLLSILQRCRELASRSDDSDWSCMDVKDLLESLDHAIQRLEKALPVEIEDLRFLFVATGPLQETSMSNGWAEEFLILAERFDKIAGESP